MTHFRRQLLALALVLLVAGVRADSPVGAPRLSLWQATLALLPDPLPEPPVGALLFGAFGWWLLTHRRDPVRPVHAQDPASDRDGAPLVPAGADVDQGVAAH